MFSIIFSIADSPGSKEALPEKTQVDIVTPTHAETEVGSIKTMFSEPEYLSGAGEAQASDIETEVIQLFIFFQMLNFWFQFF